MIKVQKGWKFKLNSKGKGSRNIRRIENFILFD